MASSSKPQISTAPQACSSCKTAWPFAHFPLRVDGTPASTCTRCCYAPGETARWRGMYRDMNREIAEARSRENDLQLLAARRQQLPMEQIEGNRNDTLQTRIMLSNIERQHQITSPLSSQVATPPQPTYTLPPTYPAFSPDQNSPFDLQPPGGDVSYTPQTTYTPVNQTQYSHTPFLQNTFLPQSGGGRRPSTPQQARAPAPTAAITSSPLQRDMPMPWSLRCMEEPGRASVWVKMLYYPDPNSSIPQGEVYKHYRYSFPPLPTNATDKPLPPQISGVDLIHVVPRVWPSVKVGGKDLGYRFIGLARRVIDVEAVWRDTEARAKVTRAAQEAK